MDISENIVKGVLFDLDGTIFDLNVDWVSLRTDLSSKLGFAVSSIGELYSQTNDQSALDLIGNLVTQYELAGVETGEPVDGAADLLSSLVSGTTQVAIVSRNSKHVINAAVAKLLEPDHQSKILVVGREDVRRLKPHPEGILTALQSLDLTPEECLFIGDTYHDVDAAQAIGMRSIIMAKPNGMSPEGADFYVDDFTELTSLLF